MRRSRVIRAAATGLCALSVALPTGGVTAARGPLEVRVGENADQSHIEFRGSGAAGVSTRRDGQTLIVRFRGTAAPDLARLHIHPPKFLKTASSKVVGGGLELTMTLADGADAHVGQADGATFINLFAKAEPPPPAGPAPSAAASNRPNPAPDNGVVVVQAQESGGQLLLRFPWKAPPAAAVFRRGDAVWVVFDGRARLDLRALPKVSGLLQGASAVTGPDFTALRLRTPPGEAVNAIGEGATWTVVLGVGAQRRPSLVNLGRDKEASLPSLSAVLAGASRTLWIADPVVGDRIAVVPALGPAKGLATEHDFVDLDALASAQGLAFAANADDLSVETEGDIVRVSRPSGLKLSPEGVGLRAAEDLDLPRAAPMPGLVLVDEWSRTGPGGFMRRYDQMLGLAAGEVQREADGDKSSGVSNRMALARFLVGSGLSFEAIGVLNLAAKAHPELMNNAEFRGLRGAAKVMAGRYKEADTDFAAPVLSDDPASALWRGYSDAQQGRWQDARTEFQKGLRAMTMVSPLWKSRFARADAEAALNLQDYATAHSQIAEAEDRGLDPMEQLATYLVLARIIEAEGAPERALPIFDAVARAPLDKLSEPAMLHATQIRFASGQMAPAKAEAVLDGLRFRWRGDATELEVVRTLGQMYLSQGHYREALEALRGAGKRLPDMPQSSQLQADLSAAFRNLFLNGAADGLEPIQALGLFYDFKELTPIGAEGDEMVRRLARRLMDVDLLDQAAELLKYQAENRLDGVPRAIVSTDLATVELMARNPEAALQALNSSRTTLLPTTLTAQRRIIEARAWMQLNQFDHATEILGPDKSADAQQIRAEIAWKRREWPNAAKSFEVLLGDRWKTTGTPLTPMEESRLLRAATAYSLADDDASLTRLREHFSGFVDQAKAPDALRVALAGVSGVQVTAANFAQAISDDQSFAGWVTAMKQRFRARLKEPPPPAVRTASTPPPAAVAAAPATEPTRRG